MTNASHATTVAGIGAPTPALPVENSKRFASIAAALAVKGYALHRLADGCLLIERWGCSRTFDTLTQAAQFLTQISGAT
ncbi:MAG: hypothetical protein H7346_07845 [Burkholderiaceae bacterium]|nr:hypothetical protein [Burkholderiaceae bacterium]